MLLETTVSYVWIEVTVGCGCTGTYLSLAEYAGISLHTFPETVHPWYSAYDAIYPAADDHLFHPDQKHEGLEPHRPSAMLLAGTDDPDYHIDIEPFMDIKISALLAHASQMGGRDAESLKRMYEERIQASMSAGESADLPKLRESFKKVILRR